MCADCDKDIEAGQSDILLLHPPKPTNSRRKNSLKEKRNCSMYSCSPGQEISHFAPVFFLTLTAVRIS